MFKFNQAQEVRSTISGFRGKVTSRAEQTYGDNRIHVQPPVDKDGKLPDGYWFDESELEPVTFDDIKIEPAKKYKFALGSKVISEETGLKGIIGMRSEHHNGCIQYLVRPKSKKGTEEKGAWWCYENELTLLKSPKTEVKRSTTGGPPKRGF